MDIKSRIQDVPSIGRPKKRSTGIVCLNLLLDGGFTEGTLVTLHGSPIAEVDLAARQFWRVEGEEGTYLMNDGDVDIGMVDTAEMHPEMYIPQMYIPQMIGGRIVIDSLSTMIIKYGIDSALKFLRLVREEARKRGANVVFIVYTGIHSPMEVTRIMRMADVVIEFKTDVHQVAIERTLLVHKVRDAAAPQRLLPFIITEKGREASTTSHVV